MRRKITYKDVRKLPDEESQKKAKRFLRAELLSAWDIYSKNVAYGIQFESIERHQDIVAWFQALKDLENWAFEYVPEEVKQYLKK